MNQVVDENIPEIKSNKLGTNPKKKNKKAKEHSETTEQIKLLNEENLSDTFENSLHISTGKSNLRNGTSDHEKGTNSPSLFNVRDDSNAAQGGRSEACHGVLHYNVNNVQLPSILNNICDEQSTEHTGQSCSSQIHLVKNLVEEALENLETALHIQHNQCSDDIEIVSYESELQMPEIMRLIQKDLSEPYSIYTYRYFIHNWPKLCFLAMHKGQCIGAIVCKLDLHRNVVKRGYIAMLAVDGKYRNRKIGSRLVRQAIQAMIKDNADEVVLETEITNKPALKLYENLGFVRDKRLFRYYLNGVDALRLKLWLR